MAHDDIVTPAILLQHMQGMRSSLEERMDRIETEVSGVNEGMLAMERRPVATIRVVAGDKQHLARRIEKLEMKVG